MRNARRLSCLVLLSASFFAAPRMLLAAPPTGCNSSPQSNIGCEFYALTLPNAFLDQTMFPFGVGLLNPTGSDVDVTITGGGLASADNVHVTAGTSVTSVLPWLPAFSYQSQPATATATSIQAGAAYHLTSTGPVSALQLNSTNASVPGFYSGSNDASLLIPVQSAGTSYRAVVWPTWGFVDGTQYPGEIAIVSTAAATTVQIAAPGTIEPGAGLDANGGSVVLDQGDVLLISSALDAADTAYGSDLSGTLITSSAPVLVWTGHIGTWIPASTGYGDHLEEILPPLAALGNDYFVVRPGNPNPAGPATDARHYVKLVGTVDGTTLTTDPAIGGVATTINAGQSVTFEATVDFHLQSSSPIVVGLFMEGSVTTAFEGYGDPSQSIAIPTTQAKRSVDFLAPAQLAPISAQVVAPTGAIISIDGATVSGWTAIGASGFSTTNVALSGTDVHHAIGNKQFTLSVFAYPTGQFTSYWYPASLGVDPDEIFANGFE